MISTENIQFSHPVTHPEFFYTPCQPNLWSPADRRADSIDVHNTLVSNSMRRNKFDEIMKNLHFADDTILSMDRY